MWVAGAMAFTTQENKLLSVDQLLNMPLTALLDVEVVTASHTSERIADIPASIVIISREEIQAMGYESLGEILRHVPGLYAMDDYTYPYNFGIRGFWTDTPNKHMTIMLNGVKRPANYTDDNDLRYLSLPPEAIERIEIIRGPQSLVHGSGAFFGVINLVTVPGRPAHRTEAVLATGSRAEKRLTALLHRRGEKYALSAHASILEADGYNYQYSDMGSPNQDNLKDHLHHYILNTNISLQSGPLSLQVYHTENRSGSIFLIPSVDQGTSSFNPMTTLSARHDQQWTPNWRTRFQLTYSRTAERYDYHIINSDYFGLQNIMAAGWHWSGELHYARSNRFNLTLGVEGQHVYETSNSYDLPGFQLPALEHVKNAIHPDDALKNYAVYVRINAALSRRLRLVSGLRVEKQPTYRMLQRRAVLDESGYTLHQVTDRMGNNQWALIPELAAIFQPSPAWAVKALYGKAMKHPSIFQSLGQNRSEEARTLKPEWIETYELAIRFEPSPHISVSTSFFYSLLDDLILRSTGFFPPDDAVTPSEYYNYFDNIGTLKTYGGECQACWQLSPRFRFELAATKQKLKDKSRAAIPTGYSPEWLYYGKTYYKFSNQLQMGMTLTSVNAMQTAFDPAPQDITNPASPPIGRIGRRVPGYTLIGMNLSFIPAHAPKMTLRLRISNLLGTKIWYPTTTNSVWAPKGTLGVPRSLLLSAGIRF